MCPRRVGAEGTLCPDSWASIPQVSVHGAPVPGHQVSNRHLHLSPASRCSQAWACPWPFPLSTFLGSGGIGWGCWDLPHPRPTHCRVDPEVGLPGVGGCSPSPRPAGLGCPWPREVWGWVPAWEGDGGHEELWDAPLSQLLVAGAVNGGAGGISHPGDACRVLLQGWACGHGSPLTDHGDAERSRSDWTAPSLCPQTSQAPALRCPGEVGEEAC